MAESQELVQVRRDRAEAVRRLGGSLRSNSDWQVPFLPKSREGKIGALSYDPGTVEYIETDYEASLTESKSRM